MKLTYSKNDGSLLQMMWL